jgi:hypothetical protein
MTIKYEEEEFLDQTWRQGYEQGERWAEQDAERVELTRLKYSVPEIPDPYVVYDCTQRKYETNEERVQAADAWWDHVLGDGGAALVWEGDFLDGFIEGALEILETVKYKL